jgi:hypothetical protein
MAVYSVNNVGGTWRIFRDGTQIEGKYASRDEAQAALQDMLRAAFRKRPPPLKAGINLKSEI